MEVRFTDEFVREIEMWLTDNVINKVSPLKAAAALWDGVCDVLVDVIDTAGSIIVDALLVWKDANKEGSIKCVPNGKKVKVMFIKSWYAKVLLANGTAGYMNKKYLK